MSILRPAVPSEVTMLKKILLGLCLGASAQLAVAEETQSFEIKGYSIENASLIATEELLKATEPYAGKERGMADIQAAMAALEKVYARRGYGAVKTVLPEQDLEEGMVRLRVIEATIGEVEVIGNIHFPTDNIRRSVPGLVEGAHPNLEAVDSSLRVANDSAAKQTNLILRQGTVDGQINASLRVSDEEPLRFAVSADNTGVPGGDGKYATGRYRTGFIAQHANLFNRDHAASIQYLTSPDHLDQVKVLGIGYRIPLYSLGDVLEFAYGYSNVDSGKLTTVAGPIGISGSGQVYSAKYEQMLPRWGDWLGKLTYGLDYRVYTNKVQADGSSESLIPDATVHPFSLTYGGQIAREGRVVSGAITYAHNIPGGNDGRTEDFTKPGGRAGATANYQLWRLTASVMQSLPADWMLKLAINGQYTNDALISGEQFGVGGQDSVRGFYERQLANDSGLRGSVEVYTPELLGRSELKLRALAFYDAAGLWRNKAQPGELANTTVASAGIGLRGGYGKTLSYRVDWAMVTDGGASKAPGDNRVHASLILSF